MRSPVQASSKIRPAADREVEVKLVGDRAALDAAFAAFAGAAKPRAHELLSVYFDTADDALSRHACALRVRAVRGRHVQSFKWAPPFDGVARGEREARVASPEPDLAALGEACEAMIREIIVEEPLAPRFSTKVKRRTVLVEHAGARVEIAYDIGEIRAGDHAEPVAEIELELREGDVSALLDLAAATCRAHGLAIGVRSKAERGFALASGGAPRVRKGSAPSLEKSAARDDVIARVIDECLDHFTANWPAFAEARHQESVHQMRVAMRRLRTALAFFHRAVPSSDFQRFRADAKRLATEMGMAREMDVFDAFLREGPAAACADDADFARLLAAVATRREAGYARIAELLADPATSAFVLELRGLVARRGWRAAVPAEDIALLATPAIDFARETLARLDRRALKRGRKIASKPPEERHEARIALKNIRYAAEFFATLFPDDEVQKYARACARAQDALGVANDIAQARGVLAGVEPLAGEAASKAVGVVIGWCAQAATAHGDHLKRRWKAFRVADRYW